MKESIQFNQSPMLLTGRSKKVGVGRLHIFAATQFTAYGVTVQTDPISPPHLLLSREKVPQGT